MHSHKWLLAIAKKAALSSQQRAALPGFQSNCTVKNFA